MKKQIKITNKRRKAFINKLMTAAHNDAIAEMNANSYGTTSSQSLPVYETAEQIRSHPLGYLGVGQEETEEEHDRIAYASEANPN